MQSGACHGMVFSMDFQETKKQSKSKREKKKRGRGGNEQNKAIEKSSLASGLVEPEPMGTGLPQAPLARNLNSGVRGLGQGQAKFLDFHLSFGFEFGPKKKQKGKRKTKGEAKI